MSVATEYYNVNKGQIKFDIESLKGDQHEVAAKVSDTASRNAKIKAVVIVVGAVIAAVGLFAIASVIATSLSNVIFGKILSSLPWWEIEIETIIYYAGVSDLIAGLLTYVPAAVGTYFLGKHVYKAAEKQLMVADSQARQALDIRLEAARA